tara:strand:- start:474 stop:1661 length:1188 start_codon:yes stop_codon:yes gene_type:complete
MFTNMQQRRGMARKPQGILASGPRIMNAAMQQQEPVRMAHGGYHNPFQPTIDMLNKYILGSETQIGDSSPSGSTSNTGQNPAPGADVSEPDPNIDSNQAGDVNFSEILPAPVGGAPYPQPGAIDSTTGKLKTPDPRTEERRQAAEDAAKNEESSGTTLMQALDDLRNRARGDDKSTKEYVEEANALLKEFGIDAPDLKGRKDLRIMEFFLNMAAGQSPDFLTNVAQAGKEAFKGYGEDVKEIEAAEQKLKLAGLEMGMAEKARAAATEQAILFKEFDITADAIKKINDLPDKSQQVQVLMDDYNVPLEKALKMVYPERTVSPQGYELRRDDLIALGHSPAFATYLSLGGATLMGQIGEGDLITDNIIRAIGPDNLNQKDRDFLQPDETAYRAGGG